MYKKKLELHQINLINWQILRDWQWLPSQLQNDAKNTAKNIKKYIEKRMPYEKETTANG